MSEDSTPDPSRHSAGPAALCPEEMSSGLIDGHTLLDRAGIWVSRHSIWCLIVFSAVYWFVAIRIATHEAFGFDELVTWKIARLPSLTAMWQAVLVHGIDLKLPLLHLLVRLSHAVLGPSHLSTRIPPLFGFWVCLLSLYFLLKPYVATPYALAGMILPVISIAWDHSWQARGYGELLGATWFALLCWQTAAGGSRLRKPALVGITVALTFALATNIMAALLAVPFAIGELLRSAERRRIDFPVWAAFGLSAWPVLVYPQAMAAARDYDLHGLYPRLESLAYFYELLLGGPCFVVVIAAIAVFPVGRDSAKGQHCPLNRPLVGALLALLALPAIFIAVAFSMRQFVFDTRYGLWAVIGFAALLTAGASHICRGSMRSGMVILMVLAGWEGFAVVKPTLKHMPQPASAVAAEYPLLRQALRGDLPVVVANSSTFWLSTFYLPPPEADRLHFLTDRDNAWRSSGESSPQHVLRMAQLYFPTRGSVEAYDTFLRNNRRFVVHVRNNITPHYLYYLLDRDRCVVTLLSYSGNESLFTVDVGR